MSPNNQNEYEIIDTPSSNSLDNQFVRYPLAKEPTQVRQNLNYKDWLNSLDENNNQSFGVTPRRASVVGAVGSILGATLGTIPYVGDILALIVGIFWPEGSDPEDYSELINAIMEQVELLIDQKISEQVRNDALATLESSGIALQAYLNALEDWKINPNNARSTQLVRERFTFAEAQVRTNIAYVSRKDYEILLLPIYAQVANIHLLLLKQVQLYGTKLGYTQNDIDLIYEEQKKFTAQYTNHCTNWYNIGLNNIWESIAGTSYSGSRWDEFNDFRRDLTLTVLDIVSTFPIHDTRLYPEKVNGQLTREIYTRSINVNYFNQVSARTIEDAERLLTNPPRLLPWIEQLEFNTNVNFSVNWKFLTSTRRRFIYTNSSDLNYDGYAGYHLDGTSNSFLYPSNNERIYTITAQRFGEQRNIPQAITGLTFSMNTGRTYRYSSNTPAGPSIITEDYHLPGLNGEEVPNSNNFSHFLRSINGYSNGNQRIFHSFGWTHASVDFENKIYPTIITQIPAVKAIQGTMPYPVVKGPGFTGGDIARLPNNPTLGLWFNGTMESLGSGHDPAPRYRVRIRYASQSGGSANFRFMSSNGQNSSQQNFSFTSTMTTGEPSKYEDFRFSVLPNIVTPLSFNVSWHLVASNANPNNNVYIDRIEFIPEFLMARSDLETAKKAVNELFTNTKNSLRREVTDYQVSQAVSLVECLSDELYPNEKRMLIDAVKEAKRLSEARNLLEDIDLKVISEYGEDGWIGSKGIEVAKSNPLYKNDLLRLPKVREIEGEIYPTYLYYKVDESLLKPYTRYKFRGFIESSRDLEIFVIRHQAYRVVKNVPSNLLSDIGPVNACGGFDRCSEQKYVNSMLELDNDLSNENRSSEAHEFSIHVDTGELNYSENPGIWVAFKITKMDGYATVGNLELVEVETLSGEALERVQRQEKQWQGQLATRRKETETRYGPAKQAIDRLFVDYQDRQLYSGTKISDLIAAQNLVQSIPYVYNDMLPEIPGMNYTSVTELTNRLQQAWNLYDQRNSIQNGDFRKDINNWNVTNGVNIQQMNDTSVLVIPNWDSQVSQQITVQPNRRYVLRVTARKEGSGDGYVTIRDGAKYTETLTFNTCDYNGS
ncbi:insecticidal delta-endotoxin Cry8Ea1 family protein, partial [Bacillus thuringiensis]|uniref:insecticidal delta-endotoxin Cry8Ea1 family protein n=1 Tax=Bacillus thuringiensis TaxID=1428 RepID=UPI0005393E8F